jgi:hypothetical protein
LFDISVEVSLPVPEKLMVVVLLVLGIVDPRVLLSENFALGSLLGSADFGF